MKAKQESLFEGARLRLSDSIELSLDSLREYGGRYLHWASAYSGGKDSSTKVTFVAWAILEGLLPAPESWTVLYSDTRQELPPLHYAAMQLLAELARRGVNVQVVLPEVDKRFYVYLFGRGVPPPSNTFRWCTLQIKVNPMLLALEQMAVNMGFGRMVEQEDASLKYQGDGDKKFLMLTGVRFGESAVRDQRITLSCSKDSGECGQGWFQVATPESIADTLAPLLHWRLCHIYDWLFFETRRHGFPQVTMIADVYGDDDVRTGCIGCNLVQKDTALLRLLKYHPQQWGYLHPLLEIKPLFRELKKAKNRKRKTEPEYRKDGSPAQNIQRLGPLTMKAREYGLERLLDIQNRINELANGRPAIDLINAEEQARIRQLWGMNTWPNKWTGEELTGDIPIDAKFVTKLGIVTQPLLVK